MGQYLNKIHSDHEKIKNYLNAIPCELAKKLCGRWKQLGIPFFMTPAEFQKNIVGKEELHLNYEKYYSSGIEIEVLEFLTSLILMSVGSVDQKMESLFDLYEFENEGFMTAEEFYVCIDKCFRSICEEGLIQLPYVEQESLEEFKDEICSEGEISLERFKEVIQEECKIFSEIFEDSYNFLRTLSTHIIENPYSVINYLEPGNLFLGKYEIISPPILIEDISSIYKRKYKHAILDVKPMIGEEGKLKFELIYLTGLEGDKSFRQNYFREIVLKNKLNKEEVNEFGELPGGILYKSISELEATEMTLKEYLKNKKKETSAVYSRITGRRKLVCLNERETIDLGLRLLDQLDILHQMRVQHSNINPSSVYLLEKDIRRLRFLDLELAIWEPIEILGTDSPYFQQRKGDEYDTTFRDDKYLAPEHKELAKSYTKTGELPIEPLSFLYDLYSIGAIMYKAITGHTPVEFSMKTQYFKQVFERDNLEDWKCPDELNHLIMSNKMAVFLITILHSEVSCRFQSIQEVRRYLESLQNSLDSIPRKLLQGLEHIPTEEKLFDISYVLDLSTHGIDDFCLEYLYKFIVESRIPNIRLFGDVGLPIRALSQDPSFKVLNIANENIYAEELKLLSFFIQINESLTEIDLSKNPILNRHKIEGSETEVKSREDQHQVSNLGFRFFLTALMNNSNLVRFELAEVNLGPEYAKKLCVPISKNLNMQRLNLAGCELGEKGVKFICRMAKEMQNLEYINLSSNRFGNGGAIHVANLLEVNHNILEIDLFRNNIGKEGGEAIGNALTNNFIIHKLSIGDNNIEQNEKDLILESVMFNTQYKKLKATNERFGEFGYNLMAESIKRWIEKSNFVMKKLEARLHECEDEIDTKLAELLLDEKGFLIVED